MDFKILDASAFYAGVPFGANDNWCTTFLVYNEIKHIKKGQDILNTMIETGRLEIRDPQKESIKKAISMSKKTGDYNQLSKQDISILALSHEISHSKIVTDDFAISNVAKYLSIDVLPIMTSGIKDQGIWIHYCPGCKKNYKKNYKECPVCATPLKRKLLKRRGGGGDR